MLESYGWRSLMGKNSKIEWTDHTFNPWWGCVKVSPGCENCYAERLAHRLDFDVWGVNANRRWMSKSYWQRPEKNWNKISPGRVFCGSMCDIFEIHKDPMVNDLMDAERQRLWNLIQSTPNLEWLLLTKRIDNVVRNMNIRALLESGRLNIRLGITVCNQEEFDRDVPKLIELKVPNFISMEPLLGAVEFSIWPWVTVPVNPTLKMSFGPAIDWVIVGGESGPHARPMHPDWVRSIRDQCNEANVPFFFKQWGEWLPLENKTTVVFDKVGKMEAGSILDGEEWKEFPK